MLALNITRSLRGTLDDRPSDVRSCTERWWVITDGVLTDYGDLILAVAGNTVAGVFEVRRWSRDPQHGGKVVLDLAEAPGWQWLIGQPSPVTWAKSQANPVRKVSGAIASDLRARCPALSSAGHGWSLAVDPGGDTATVRGPGRITVIALDDYSASLATQPQSEQNTPGHQPAGPERPLAVAAPQALHPSARQ